MAVSIHRLLVVVAAPAICVLAAASCQSNAPAVLKMPISAEEVVVDYPKFQRMTPEHVAVLSSVADCVSKGEIQKQFDTARTISVRMNDAAREAFNAKGAAYPAGAVIVKEKLLGQNPTALGGMIKRAKGFDPDHGDWEYFYANIQQSSAGPRFGIVKFDSGKLNHCVQCHNAVAEKDHVYGTWRGGQDYHNNNSIEK